MEQIYCLWQPLSWFQWTVIALNGLNWLHQAWKRSQAVLAGITLSLSCRWNSTVQTLVASYEAYEDLMKKSQEGKEFYEDLEGKASKLLEKAKAVCQAREEERQTILER